MLRSFIAIVVGYVVFAVPVAGFFLLSGRDPHATLPILFIAVSIAWGMAFAAAGGYTAARLAPQRAFAHAGALATLVAIGSIVSILTRPAGEPIWSQLVALVLVVPSVVAGGWLRVRRPKGKIPW